VVFASPHFKIRVEITKNSPILQYIYFSNHCS